MSGTMPAWAYTTAAGFKTRGYVESTSDRGGTDVTYFFRRETGELDVLSGARLREARRLPGQVIDTKEPH